MSTPTLPTGTVTFLFTDIEGSTAMLQRLGPEYRDVMERHARVIRGSVADHHGVEVGTEGDSFFVVFESAVDAVRAAGAIQLDLAAQEWPETGAVRVRIGVHTGEGRMGGDNYLGIDVHRAARIGAAGHGGQVVVSTETHALTSSAHEYIDLGVHSLKDLDAPEHLYQLVIAGLPAEFPPLRSASARSHNLPALATGLVGRTAESDRIAELLAAHRVVTITGPGGVGKTRLALHTAGEVLERFSSGVFFVDLAPLSDAELVPPAIATTLSVGDATVPGLIAALHGKELLLVLDNFEHVAGAAGSVAALIAGLPLLAVLATSQRPLRIAGEHVVPLQPLGTGNGRVDVDAPAVQLFASRASATDPSFDLAANEDDVISLVKLLDGLPLAIELAAAWSNILTPRQILDRLTKGAEMLATRDVDTVDRHRSLRTAIEWSVALLDERQRTVLRRLAVFAGGMSIEAVEAVVGDDIDTFGGLADLVERSLVQRSMSGLSGSRFDMLEATRAFATDDLLEAGEADEVEARHTDFFCALAGEAAVQLEGERLPLWVAKLGEDWDNLRVALSRLLAAGDARRGLELIGSIWRFAQSSGHVTEAMLWLDRFFALPGAEEPSAERARALIARAALWYWKGNPDAALTDYEEAVLIARGVEGPDLLADALYGLATSYIVAGEHDAARDPMEEAKSLYAAAGNRVGLAHVFGGEAFAAFTGDDPAEAREMLERSVELYREVGHRVYAAQITLALTGVALTEGRFENARTLALEALGLADEINDQFLVAWAIQWVAAVEVEMGDPVTGLVLAGAANAARDRFAAGWTPLTVNVDDAPTRARERMSETAVEAAMDQGRGLSLEEAMMLARDPERGAALR